MAPLAPPTACGCLLPVRSRLASAATPRPLLPPVPAHSTRRAWLTVSCTTAGRRRIDACEVAGIRAELQVTG